ncbi:DNA mismatch repair protein MutS [Brumimicrobium salinarum]|uniref:DNA mismatch repair protein MutS n=1 Tax=Brumimicrobium salinarum TaxID=2058658 RepID=A0A2I0R1Q6_9FLAO|nr:MutS2/Smr-associated SH3 domain-containing protein [Brumimicrobium salinarum]PKR80499.1 DNA mismatch repair protein MutS [Brumimicrobium salinarum]
MLKCDPQTYKDLELEKLQDILREYCIGPSALQIVDQLKPVKNNDELIKFLNQTNELVEIRREAERFPRLEFEELKSEIKMLPVQNASLPQESFARIRMASVMVNSLIYFFNKREEDFPNLYELLSGVEYTKDLINKIDEIFDKHGKVKDDASEDLLRVRQQMQSVKRHIHSTFDRSMRKYLKKGYLSDTKEGFFDDRRVLAVLSSYKREVNGQVVSNSKSGNVTFIEPGETIPLNNEYEQLLDDERKEIFVILQQLTFEMLAYLPLIKAYQQVLTKLDFINAKSRLALLLDANLPSINENKEMELIDCYHPLLKLNNKSLGKNTVPQRISMNKDARMLVISGPNAGGKSITLKTVGLLQLMLQCGLLVPLHPNSKMCLFDALLTDIGDNQSIVDELSTYSYRLKRMRHFLNVSNENTLLLLDEFGTGSDPDLGGALAEVFFETLYDRKSFGVITTHYANIKLKADELPEAINGCMLFDTETLNPLFRFSMGQPGSSFTFEVAQINGIPKKLINKAKSKLDHKKVKMDELLHELQKEKSYLNRLTKEHILAQETAEEHRQFYETTKKKYDQKLQNLKDRAEETSKFVSLGKKLQQFINDYKVRSKKKNSNADLMQEVKKYIAMEKSKIEEVKQEVRLKKQANKKKKTKKVKDQYNQAKIKVGSKVKMISTKQTGEVEEIKGEDVTVLLGFARMKVKLSQLIWVSD